MRGATSKKKRKSSGSSTKLSASPWRGIIDAYKEHLPVTAKTPIISLCEGNTPLIHAPSLSKAVNADVYLKYEGLNPTGSFKDRGMTMALSKAVEDGAKTVVCASTGNTSASAAAYAARAGLKCAVLIPEGKIALGKLSQALVHDAVVLAVKGNFDEALRIVRELGRSGEVTVVNSVNPYRIEGQKTGAFEVVDQLSQAPDFHIMPVGNAGNISAYWKGYKEYQKKGKSASLPMMIGFQAAGAAPIVKNKIVEKPETLATAIRIGNPAGWKTAIEARDESGGLIDAVTDKDILGAYAWLASKEGVFAEPASAASVAGLLKLSKSGFFTKKSAKPKIVCVLTGHGLKDPDCAIASAKKLRTIPAKTEAVMKALK
jgi:threonine synthase